MRICFIIGTLRFSGAEKVLTALASHLSKLGHDIHVILTLPAEDLTPHPLFAVHHVVAGGFRPLRIARRVVGLRRIVTEVAPDVTISFGYANNINSIPALLRNGVPHIVCERNNPIYDPPGRTPARLRRLIYPFASGFVFQTETIRDLFPPSIRRRSAVIANPVIESTAPPAVAPPRDLNPQVVSIGRLSDRDKNQSLLIRAFARMAEEFPQWGLELYGDGPDRGAFEDLVNEVGLTDRIRFCGRVEDPGTALDRADVFVLTSRTEGMPNALIEAMAAGVACVATDCSGGGVAALISHGVNGLISANEDEDSLVASLRQVMSDPALRGSLGRAAKGIRQTHSIDSVGDAWLRMIRAQAR